MRALLVAAVSAAALWSLPADAQWHAWPHFSFSYGVGPYSFYSPWYGPPIGVGVHVGGPVYRRHAGQQPARQGVLKLYVYPAAGQSEAQTAEDRDQCHTWATDQSGHDPTLGAGSRDEAEGYTRAFTACMEGRNYVVR